MAAPAAPATSAMCPTARSRSRVNTRKARSDAAAAITDPRLWHRMASSAMTIAAAVSAARSGQAVAPLAASARVGQSMRTKNAALAFRYPSGTWSVRLKSR